MAFEDDADLIHQASIKSRNASGILDQVANGNDTTIVQTISGPVPSISKWFADLNGQVSGISTAPARLDQIEILLPLKADKSLVSIPVANLTALKGLSTASVKFAYRMGYSTPGDDGGTFWRFDSSSTATANDVTVVAPNNGSGRWLMNVPSFINVRQGGAKVDGSTNDAPRVQAVINAALAAKVGVEFPQGVCICSSALSVTLSGVQSFSMRGAGAALSSIQFSSTNGFNISSGAGNWWLDIDNSSGLRISGIAMVTSSVATGNALNFDMGSLEGRPSRSIILNDVEFRGTTGLNQSWATGLALKNSSYVTCIACRWLMDVDRMTTGVFLSSTDDTTDPTEIHFIDCVSVYGNFWINCGNYVEGVYLTNCSAIANNCAIYFNNTTGESGLHVIGGHYSSFIYNFYLNHMNDFTISTALLYSLGISGGTTIQVVIDNASRGTMTGCTLVGGGVATETGVLVQNSNGFGISLSGNTFESHNGNMIRLAPTSSKVSVGQNSYSNIKNGNVPVLDQTSSHANNVYNGWSTSVVQSLTGGTSASISIPVASGQLAEKPKSASMVCSSGQRLIGFYEYDTSTITNLVFTMLPMAGGNLPSGSVRLSVTVA